MSLVDTDTGEIVPATLADHEAVIERGLQSFVDVGNSLLAIKAGKLYRESGYSTFEDYCARRWTISRAHGYRLVVAAATTQALMESLSEMSPMGDISAPETERQIRALAAVPEDKRPEVWLEAVETADGASPTAKQVEEAATIRRKSKPAETAEQRAAREHDEAIDRRVKRLEMFCSSVHEFRALASNPDRDEVLARLTPGDREIVLNAERSIRWAA